MNTDLIDEATLSPEARWQQPSSEFFTPTDVQESTARKAAEQRITAALDATPTGTPAAIVITDDDADGFGAYAVLRHVYDAAAIVPAGPHGILDVAGGLSLVADIADSADIWVTDIRPDPTELPAVRAALDDVRTVGRVHWVDHHPWDVETEAEIESLVHTLVVDDGSNGVDRCASELVASLVEPLPDALAEAIEVTGVYDCWKKDEDDEFIDRRAPDLADYAELVDDPDTYVDAIIDHGADIATDTAIAAALEDHRDILRQLDDCAMDEASLYVVNEAEESMSAVLRRNWERLKNDDLDDVEWTLAITYGTCDTNAVADRLGDETGADAVAIVKPSGGLSFRSRGAFTRCNSVAAKFDGGGHETAAGAHVTDGEFGIELDSMAAYGGHWYTCGEDARRAVRRAFLETIRN